MPAPQPTWQTPAAVCPACGDSFGDAAISHCPHDGTPLDRVGDGPSTMVERVVGERYRLLARLGEGGMGTVFAAEERVSLRRVALKIIKPELESSKIARDRFLRECHLLERIDSPYVVQVYESGEKKKTGEIFLVMELLEGATLGHRLESAGALPPAEAVRVGIQIAHALRAAHAEGIVHRDLKPDNVFLCEDGTVRVLDFGIARLLDGVTLDSGSRKLTATGTIVGTPAYISPEGAAGGHIGPAADLYSFGVLLYEMLAGELPFWDDHPVLMMGMHLKTPPPRLDEGERDLPPDLVELVDELLRKEPTERPQGADVVLARLEALRGQDGTLVMNAVDTLPAGPRAAPRPPWAVIAGVAAVAALGLASMGAWWATREEPEPDPVPISAEPLPDSRPRVDPVPSSPDPEPTETIPAGVEPEEESSPGAEEEAAPEDADPGADEVASEDGDEGENPAERSTSTAPEPTPAARRGRRSARRRARRGRRSATSRQPRPLGDPGGRRGQSRGDDADGMVRDYW